MRGAQKKETRNKNPAYAGGYAGDVLPQTAWEKMAENKDAALIDVRSQSEWHFVGVPVLEDLGREVIFVEWQFFPSGQRNPHFSAELCQHLREAPKGETDRALFFLCRSGQRSAAAAAAMQREGFRACFNIAGGFEGNLDEYGHRGTSAGWKQSGLPWKQS